MTSPMVADLRRLLPPDRTSDSPEDLERHATDALGRYRAFRTEDTLEALPGAIVRPQSTEETAAVTAFATERGIAVVPFGAGTGVMGGAIPAVGGIVLDLGRLDQIEDVDVEGRRATAGAGVVLEDLNTRLAEHGLLLGHDPWSRPIATVGGAISTNGMGYMAGQYGSMGEQVLGLEVALATGEVVRSKAVPKVAGPDLDALFIGAEGTMGVITRATVEAHPIPERRGLHAYRFSGFPAGFQAVQEMYAIGLRPSLIDFAEELSLEAPSDDPVVETTLYLGFEGIEEVVVAQEARADRLCRQAGGEPLDPSEAAHFWETRHASAERYKREVLGNPAAVRRRSTWRMDYLHMAVPASRMLEYHRFCGTLLRERGIPVREWSLWGRPEYFSLLIADPTPADSEDRRLMAEAVDDLLIGAQDLGGSIEYCHGVGLKLSHLMERELGPGMEAFRRVKRALDPSGILNAGTLGV